MTRRSSLHISIAFFGIVLFSSCLEETEGNNVSVKDLVGVWEDSAQDNTFVEQWQINPDGSLSGTGFVMAGNDTVFIEQLNIREVNGVMTYFAQVMDHNQGRSIPFGLKEKQGSSMVFENLQHDFPQRIIYEVPNDTSMFVYIEGTENGQFRKRKLSFLKKSE